MADIERLFTYILELLKHEITIFDFKVSFWQILLFDIVASIFAMLFRSFFIDD